MKTNNIGNITMSKSGYSRSRIPLSHDVNTTCGFGEVQPLMCRSMFADSKAVVELESLVRLAPMLAPTFGDVKFKTYHEFVAMSDLTANFNALLSETRVNRGGESFVPRFLPHVPLSLLSVACLIGAQCTIYRANPSGAPVWHTYRDQSDGSSGQITMQELINTLCTELGVSETDILKTTNWSSGSPFEGADRCGGFNYTLLSPNIANNYINGRFIPLWNSGAPVSFGYSVYGDTHEFSIEPIYLESADVIVERSIGNYRYSFAFRLSSFGKRIRKALLGCGYQINFNSTKLVSLMPLFAYYRAWYELFGLQLFQNFEDTACNKLLQLFDNHNIYDYHWRAQAEHMDNLFAFFVELGSMWFTDSADFVSSHTANITSNSKSFDLNSFVDVYGASSDWNSASHNVYTPYEDITEDSVAKNVHLRTITQNHGQLDSELLKRLYKWTNRNSILGQKVRDLLVAQGLQDFVDSCEPRFIGFDETTIQISDVVSQADTETTDGRGALLGEYGGRGLQYKKGKSLTFETREYGFWITLAVVAPVSGYCQSLDMNNACVMKEDFYNPEFDGLGMEANPKLVVCASQDVNSIESLETNKSLDATFGFIPRYSRLKVASNVMNGDFNLRSTRNSYMPYTLDKILNVGDKNYRTTFSDDRHGMGVSQVVLFEPEDLPIAGNVWRFNGRYPFLANYNRIFANQGNFDNSLSRQADLSFEFTDSMLDNFLIHNAIRFDWYAPVLPIEDSFETHDDGNEGKTDMSVAKA